jgi:hypothetical protein
MDSDALLRGRAESRSVGYAWHACFWPEAHARCIKLFARALSRGTPAPRM